MPSIPVPCRYCAGWGSGGRVGVHSQNSLTRPVAGWRMSRAGMIRCWYRRPGDARPVWTLEDLKRAAGMARDGRVSVLQFHGVPDREHPWVNTPPERFAEYVEWLRKEGYRCIALRDLERYVDSSASVSDPWAMMDWRRSTGR